MMDKGKLVPIVVGVTGHRDLRVTDEARLKEVVKGELEKLRKRVPNSQLLMLNSLAEGGDLLCADAAAELGIPVAAALPMEEEKYAAGFSEDGKERLSGHLKTARSVFVVPHAEAEPEQEDQSRMEDHCYRQAGIYISLHCHVLLALWDGSDQGNSGCGTAAAVSFALNGSYKPLSGMPFRSRENTAVLQILTPRESAPESVKAGGVTWLGGNKDEPKQGSLPEGSTNTKKKEGSPEIPPCLDEILARTDELNRLSAGVSPKGGLLPETVENDGVMDRLEAVYSVSDELSVRSAVRYRRVLGLLAAASTGVAAGFLLYDEAGLLWMILVCGAMLLLAWICRRWAVKADCHRRYIEYRLLAEGLRTQAYLRYAGSPQEAAWLFPRTQWEECAWIMAALCALVVGPPPVQERSIRECWAAGQRDYHEKAEVRAQKALKSSESIVHVALYVSIALYLLAVLYEGAFGGLFFPPLADGAAIELLRILLKLILGLIGAATLFIANYYGKQSLPRIYADHGKMKRFYAQVLVQLDSFGQTEELLRTLAREELVENGNWCSFQRDNTPDFSL